MDTQTCYAFCALLSRMKYINRWGLMRSSRAENLSEHTVEVSIIAHVLALLAKEEDIRPETVAVAALYHDASEILTGDMPTPVKYNNEELKNAYKAVEKQSAHRLATMLPEELQQEMSGYLTCDLLNDKEKKLLKAADIFSALIKCLDEEAAGNTEFRSAKEQQWEKLRAMEHPAIDRFAREFLPCYQKTLDELVKKSNQ